MKEAEILRVEKALNEIFAWLAVQKDRMLNQEDVTFDDLENRLKGLVNLMTENTKTPHIKNEFEKLEKVIEELGEQVKTQREELANDLQKVKKHADVVTRYIQLNN